LKYVFTKLLIKKVGIVIRAKISTSKTAIVSLSFIVRLIFSDFVTPRLAGIRYLNKFL